MSAMRLQQRLYKMNKIARRHHKFATQCSVMRAWKRFASDAQNTRLMQQQRRNRRLKIQKLKASVKESSAHNAQRLQKEHSAVDRDAESRADAVSQDQQSK